MPCSLPYSAGSGGSGGAAVGGSGTEVPPLLVDGRPHLPFQLQIEYTGIDGSRCMRVITQAKPITTDRKVAEKGKIQVHVPTCIIYMYMCIYKYIYTYNCTCLH